MFLITDRICIRNQKWSVMNKNRDSIQSISYSATCTSDRKYLPCSLPKHCEERVVVECVNATCARPRQALTSRQPFTSKLRKHRCPFRYLGWPSWLRSVLRRTGRPSAAARDEKRKIAQFANHLRRRRCALSWLTAIQYLSNLLLPVSFRLRAFGAAWRFKLPDVVGCLRLRTGKLS